jgi:outer membrane protein FlgP
MLKKMFVLLSCLVFVSGCSSFLDKHVIWEYEKPEQFPVLRAVGYAPISAQSGNDPQIRQIMAMRASKLDAYRELAEQVYGYQVKGQSEVQNLVASDDRMRAKVEGVIRGARIVKTYAVGDTYATELELDMKLVFDLYQINTRPRKIKKVEYY